MSVGLAVDCPSAGLDCVFPDQTLKEMTMLTAQELIEDIHAKRRTRTMATKQQYQSAMANHEKRSKTSRVHLVSENNDAGGAKYWTHCPDGSGDADLRSTQYYDAAIECCELHPNAEIVLVSN